MQTLCVSIGHIPDDHLHRHFLWPSSFHDARYLRSFDPIGEPHALWHLYHQIHVQRHSCKPWLSKRVQYRLSYNGQARAPWSAHVSQKIPSFPLLLAAFKTGLQKPTISSATRFVAFEPESVKSLLNVEELELQYIRPSSWRHVAQFLDCRLKRLVVDICADQSNWCLPALLSLAPSRLDALRIFHFEFATALYANPVIWGNYVLARDVFFSVTDLASTPVGTTNELRALIEWYLDCFVVAPAPSDIRNMRVLDIYKSLPLSSAWLYN